MAGINIIEADISLGLGLLSSLGPKVDNFGIFSNNAGQGAANVASGITGLSSAVLNSILGLPNAQASIGQLFINARPVRAEVRETSKVMEHPVESGVVLADHHIINPVEIDVRMIVSSQFYASTYSEIRQNFINATPLAVKTRVGVFSNMIIADMPHEEDPDKYDVITLNLRLKQFIIVVPGSSNASSNYQPLDATNSNALASGLQQATALGTQVLGVAGSIASYATALRKFG